MANSTNLTVIINSNKIIKVEISKIAINDSVIIGIIKIGTIKTKIRGSVVTESPTIIKIKNSPNNNSSSSNTSSSSSRKAMDDIITKATTTGNRDSSSNQRCQSTLRRAALKLLTLVTTLT